MCCEVSPRSERGSSAPAYRQVLHPVLTLGVLSLVLFFFFFLGAIIAMLGVVAVKCQGKLDGVADGQADEVTSPLFCG